MAWRLSAYTRIGESEGRRSTILVGVHGVLRLAVEWRVLVSVGSCLLLDSACITTRTKRMKEVSLGTVVRVSAPASDGRVEEHFESVLQMSYISCPIISLMPLFSLGLNFLSCDDLSHDLLSRPRHSTLPPCGYLLVLPSWFHHALVDAHGQHTHSSVL